MAAKPTPPPPQKRPSQIEQQQQEKRVQQILSYPIQLSDQINQTAKQATIFKSDCSDLGKRAARILHLLRSAARLSTSASSSSFYDRPLRRVAAAASPNLHKSLTLVRKCRRRGLLRRLFTIVSAAEFRKLIGLLESSIADIDWVLCILKPSNGGPTLTLPPIASTDPIISYVWSLVASIHTGEKSEAAGQLASLAGDNDRNKQIIVEEGGVPPLLKTLKDNSSSDSQIAGAIALCSLANDEKIARAIVEASGVSIIVRVLSNSDSKVKIRVGNLVSKMAELCLLAKEDFGRQNAIRPLVMILSREIEDLALRISCARALRMLAKNSVANSRRITESKGLLCLAKLVGTEKGELRYNCLMTVMEIAAVAESDADLRRAAFKKNSLAPKAAIEQLIGVIKDSGDDDDPRLTIAAIRAIGCLSRTFPARETTKIRVVGPLVERLRDGNRDVAIEAAISLGKFACPDNFLCTEHSMSIIECKGILPVLELLRGDERGQVHGLALVCYLVIHAGKSEDLDRARVMGVLEGVDRGVLARHHKLKELVSEAIYRLCGFHRVH